jgi:hypothetical protein
MIGTLSSPTNARYSPDDTPGSSAPSAPETSPSMVLSGAENAYGFGLSAALVVPMGSAGEAGW